MHARKATRGIQEYIIDIRGVPFRFVDVGGQRSQRQKWFQCFDEVTSILFLVSSSAFDQTILEDRVTNRLVESVNIFDTIVNNRCFRSVSIILFFNKTDLLAKKVKVKSIADYFTDFQVPSARAFSFLLLPLLFLTFLPQIKQALLPPKINLLVFGCMKAIKRCFFLLFLRLEFNC